MKFYFVNADADDDPPYYATLDEAKKAARRAAANSYDDIEVEQVEVDTGKDNILRLLNIAGGTHIGKGVVYTAKAGLKE
jgi:hypothetical protein